ncbi:hypothetical protein ACH4GK_28780 [Streptomyces rimosus]|uniref:hypothetical protein n=1 Tax=Streptomyces rimosus TaxID=1927 RepID=UPI00131CB242|nr:hypothetical protein [Streptomyces rimosus]
MPSPKRASPDVMARGDYVSGVPAANPGRLPKPPPSADLEVHIPPVSNAIDYLWSVSNDLRCAPPRPRKLKYVVLHLHAAAEVLLKARLARVHWTQVFRDPGAASRERYESGDFESCTLTATLERLKKIAGITVDARAAKSLTILAAWRNKLLHHGLHPISTREIETRVGQVLDFLIDFIRAELLPAVPEREVNLANCELRLTLYMTLQVPVCRATRLARLQGELALVTDRTLACPVCGEWALVTGDGDRPLACRFCHARWSRPTTALVSWMKVNWGSANRRPLTTCPQCGTNDALLDVGVLLADAPSLSRSLCGSCGVTRNRTVCDGAYLPSVVSMTPR